MSAQETPHAAEKVEAGFCPFCLVTLDLHNGPNSCTSAEGKARLLEAFGRFGA